MTGTQAVHRSLASAAAGAVGRRPSTGGDEGSGAPPPGFSLLAIVGCGVEPAGSDGAIFGAPAARGRARPWLAGASGEPERDVRGRRTLDVLLHPPAEATVQKATTVEDGSARLRCRLVEERPRGHRRALLGRRDARESAGRAPPEAEGRHVARPGADTGARAHFVQRGTPWGGREPPLVRGDKARSNSWVRAPREPPSTPSTSSRSRTARSVVRARTSAGARSTR